VAYVPEKVDVVALRTRLGLSQGELATRFGFKFDALQIGNRAAGAPTPPLARS
jgi:DNA-binding transcriptional regulator YiaG